MSKITRKIAKIFGSTANASEISEFGSLAAGSPVYSTDPTVIQSLSKWASGWFSAVIGGNSPAIEDMNALFYVLSYQLAYLMQAGVAEWDATTTYYIGSFASDGLGNIYSSIVDTNLNNALTDLTKWKLTTKLGNARFVLDDATVLYTNINGPQYMRNGLTLSSVFISMVDSGSSGATTVKVNQYRAGVLQASATASLSAVAGGPLGAACALSSALSIAAGDIVTVDVTGVPLGTPNSLSVEF